MSEVEVLRGEIRDLHARRERGDIPEKKFERAVAERTLELCRAVVKGRLGASETVLAEHHVVHAHLRLSQSILKEPEQRTTSFWLTPIRLIRLSSRLIPGQPTSCDERDGTTLDEVSLATITRLRKRNQIRFGEIAAGAVICALALLGRAWLSVTGPLLAVLGVLGILHGLLLPTRWWEIETTGKQPAEPLHIFAARKRSARALVRALRARVPALARASQKGAF
ncbi:MAG: hypothetical protein V1750_08495 [Acidobacteriota bacterium]